MSESETDPPKKKIKRWYNQKFKEEWLTDPEFKDWLTEDINEKGASYCICCDVKLKNANKSMLMTHKNTVKHKRRADTPEAFNRDWLTHEQMKDWLEADPDDSYSAWCKACDFRFKIPNKSSLLAHSATRKHKTNTAKKTENGGKPEAIKIQYFLKRPTEPQQKEELKTAEQLLTGFVAENPMSSSQTDMLVHTIKEMFPTNYIAQSIKVDPTKIPAPSLDEGGTTYQVQDRHKPNMSRHVNVQCRDPFLRDLDRDFFSDRPSRKNWFDDSPSKLFDQHFGVGLWPDEVPTGTSSLYLRSRRPPREKSGISYIDNAQEKFSIILDVPHFTPDELKVRVTGNGLEIEGKHSDRLDEHGTISRHFTRKYSLPEDVMVDMISSSLSADGVLTIEAPKKPPEPPRSAEREVPIQKMAKNAKH